MTTKTSNNGYLTAIYKEESNCAILAQYLGETCWGQLNLISLTEPKMQILPSTAENYKEINDATKQKTKVVTFSPKSYIGAKFTMTSNRRLRAINAKDNNIWQCTNSFEWASAKQVYYQKAKGFLINNNFVSSRHLAVIYNVSPEDIKYLTDDKIYVNMWTPILAKPYVRHYKPMELPREICAD